MYQPVFNVNMRQKLNVLQSCKTHTTQCEIHVSPNLILLQQHGKSIKSKFSNMLLIDLFGLLLNLYTVITDLEPGKFFATFGHDSSLNIMQVN